MVKKKSTRKSHKKKREVSNFENIEDSIKIAYSKYKSKFILRYNKFVKKIKGDESGKIKNVKSFLLMILGYGLLVNYPLHFLLGMKFSFFTFPAWGVVYYFIKWEFVEWIRGLVAKR